MKIKKFLSKLDFKVGCWLLAFAIVCYGISFGQMLLPWLSTCVKGVLWVVFFGLAKTFQYSAVVVLGKEGIMRIRNFLTRKRSF